MSTGTTKASQGPLGRDLRDAKPDPAASQARGLAHAKFQLRIQHYGNAHVATSSITPEVKVQSQVASDYVTLHVHQKSEDRQDWHSSFVADSPHGVVADLPQPAKRS